jgi:hypothetical protein
MAKGLLYFLNVFLQMRVVIGGANGIVIYLLKDDAKQLLIFACKEEAFFSAWRRTLT